MSAQYTPPKVWKPKIQDGKFGNINRPVAGARHKQVLPHGDNPLQLYSLNTPNGIKVNIMLKELQALNIAGAAFDAFKINILELDQFGSDFTEINPNSKIPAMIDQSGEQPIKLFESGAILFYLAEKFGQFLPPEHGNDRTECMNWLMWQMASAPYLGGGFGHFYQYAPEPMEYPIDRFTMEAKRQLDVLDKQLANQDYICSFGYSIADMAIFPWYGRLVLGKLYGDAHEFLNAATDFANVIRWAQRIAQRNAVKQAVDMELRPLK